jgi:CBS domain-containing protein
MARRHRWTSIKDGASLLAVVELMSKNKCHRLPVVNEKDEVVNIITQSMLIKFLAAHDEEVAAYSKRTIAAAACTTSPVLSIDATAPAIDAFKLIAKHNIFGIGILDADGNIVGNTSASDLKLFVNDPSTDLRQPIDDFISAVRCLPTASMKAVSPLFTVKSTATLSHVIAKLASTNAHRLFIVDGDGDGKAPTAVTSLSDICADICKFVDAK